MSFPLALLISSVIVTLYSFCRYMPRIACALERIATAVENNDDLDEEEMLEEADAKPRSRSALMGYRYEAKPQ